MTSICVPEQKITKIPNTHTIRRPSLRKWQTPSKGCCRFGESKKGPHPSLPLVYTVLCDTEENQSYFGSK